MIHRLVGAVGKRLLAAAGLVRAAELDRIRHAIRAAERNRASRIQAAAVAKLEAVNGTLQAARERAAAEHLAHRTTLGLLRHYLIRLERMETEVAGRVALERRVKRSQLALAARAARRRGVSDAAAARAGRLAAVSGDYAAAVSRWRAGDRPTDLDRITVSGLRWSVPADSVREPSSSKQTAQTWLPLQDLGAIRPFAVGGVMLDIGAGIGATAIPRVLLGDFTRAYAAEPDPASYLLLVGNTLDNHLEGRVLPDRVAITGSAGTVTLPCPKGCEHNVPSMTIDAWLQRHGIVVDNVRFVRIALHEWNRNTLEGAAMLLKRRHIVWQVEIPASQLGADRRALEPLTRQIATHFTNIKELGRFWADQWVPASTATEVLRDVANKRRAANLLLFNLPGQAWQSALFPRTLSPPATTPGS